MIILDQVGTETINLLTDNLQDNPIVAEQLVHTTSKEGTSTILSLIIADIMSILMSQDTIQHMTVGATIIQHLDHILTKMKEIKVIVEVLGVISSYQHIIDTQHWETTRGGLHSP